MSSYLLHHEGETQIAIEDEIRISIEPKKPAGRWNKYFETGPIPSADFFQFRREQLQDERESFD